MAISIWKLIPKAQPDYPLKIVFLNAPILMIRSAKIQKLL